MPCTRSSDIFFVFVRIDVKKTLRAEFIWLHPNMQSTECRGWAPAWLRFPPKTEKLSVLSPQSSDAAEKPHSDAVCTRPNSHIPKLHARLPNLRFALYMSSGLHIKLQWIFKICINEKYCFCLFYNIQSACYIFDHSVLRFLSCKSGKSLCPSTYLQLHGFCIYVSSKHKHLHKTKDQVLCLNVWICRV